MISRRPERLGTSTLMVLSNRPGRNSAGSRSAARLVAPITRKLAGFATCLRKPWAGGSQRLTTSMTAFTARAPNGGDVERLQLDEQLVDYAGDALAARPGAQAALWWRRWRRSPR